MLVHCLQMLGETLHRTAVKQVVLVPFALIGLSAIGVVCVLDFQKINYVAQAMCTAQVENTLVWFQHQKMLRGKRSTTVRFCSTVSVWLCELDSLFALFASSNSPVELIWLGAEKAVKRLVVEQLDSVKHAVFAGYYVEAVLGLRRYRLFDRIALGAAMVEQMRVGLRARNNTMPSRKRSCN